MPVPDAMAPLRAAGVAKMSAWPWRPVNAAPLLRTVVSGADGMAPSGTWGVLPRAMDCAMLWGPLPGAGVMPSC